MVDQRSSFTREFVRRLQGRSPSPGFGKRETDLPSYDVDEASDLCLLVSRSMPLSFHLGTGASVYTQALLPAILTAQREVVLVTCFWAPSKTRSALADTLQRLAEYRCDVATAFGNNSSPLSPLRVRICLSSRSLWQTLFHTAARDGYIYPPSSWSSALGLPDPSVLAAGGIDLQVKSLFFRPFSVMHPKFVIIDRERAFLPSCNVSWEAWLESCVEICGDAVAGLVSFYARTWDREAASLVQGEETARHVKDSDATALFVNGTTRISSSAQRAIRFQPTIRPISTLILPSSHHCNPNFRPFPWQAWPEAPVTPLNIAMLQLFEHAQHTVYVQTPDLTSGPALTALLAALARGVDVDIVTSRNMKPMEQLLTAGTTTVWCVNAFARRYRKLCASAASGGTRNRRAGNESDDVTRDLEARLPRPGHCRIFYFHASRECVDRSEDKSLNESTVETDASAEEPVHNHVKLTIVDGCYTVLGSGNMDRASWFTSQELGILFEDEDFAGTVKATVDSALRGRLDAVFDSAVPETR